MSACALLRSSFAAPTAPIAFAEARATARPPRLMPRASLLPPAARLTGTVAPSAHSPPLSLRSFAQYSSRFLISRSKPRSGGL
jgi:hypothetical protein